MAGFERGRIFAQSNRAQLYVVDVGNQFGVSRAATLARCVVAHPEDVGAAEVAMRD